jgi:acetylornithine/succinyldiaminopimelate/putrescine aminotransferase
VYVIKKLIKGDEAFSYFFKQTKGKGFFHLVELSRSQVDLVTAFDEKLVLVNKIPLKDIPKLNS